MKLKQNKAITLIALIITIIVLLILAGITIMTLTGENGLLKNSDKAVVEYSKAEAKEKLELVLMELQTDKISKPEYNEQGYVDKILNENDMQVEENVVTVDGWEFEIDRSTLKIVGEGTEIIVGETVSATDISNNPAAYYGKEVKYSTKRNTSIASIEKINIIADIDEQLKNDGIKWRIFYSDNEHIYLIASDYVKVDGDNYYKIFDTATETLEFMNTQSNWEDYVGNYAEYAVGGPTFTMFSNSWNAKHSDDKITGATGSEENGWSVDYDFNINDDLYFKAEDSYYGYWLASKSTYEGGRYLVHAGDGSVGSYGYAVSPEYGGEEQNLRQFGFRPIVCLKSDVQLQVTNEGFSIVEDDEETTEYTYKNPIVPDGFSKVNTDDAKWEDTDRDGNPDGWNNGLVIEDKDSNQFVWVPVDGSVLKYNKDYSYEDEFGKFSTGEDKYANDDSFPKGVSDDQEQIIKYGGFYIGRYEAGVPDKNGEPVNQEGIPLTQKDAVAWTNIEYVKAKASAEKMYDNTNVKSGLMTGKAWVTLCKWTMMSGQGSFNEMQHGNYAEAIEPANVEGYGEKQKTGYSEKWKNRNIYDLLGNVGEWGNASSEDSYAPVRGGSYAGGDSFSIGSSTGRAKENAYENNIGFRVMLYIM